MRRNTVAFLFFISGFAGLIHELVWLRLFTLTFGNTTQAGAVVISTFMGGLALGAWWIGKKADGTNRPLRLYALLEVGVALFALLLLALYGPADGIYAAIFRATGNESAVLGPARVFISSLLMILPCAFMGATLPVLVRAAAPAPEEAGEKAGRLYAVNTLGAVCGALFTGFFALRLLGIYPTAVIALLLNFATGVWAFFIAGKVPAIEAPKKETKRKKQTDADPKEKPRTFIIAAAAGFGALSLEIYYTRLALFGLLYTVYVWTLVLVVFLTGIAIGSAATARHSKRSSRPLSNAATLLLLMAMGMWGSLIGLANIENLSMVASGFLSAAGWRQAVTFKFLVVAVTFLWAPLFSGAAFPYLVRACQGDDRRPGRDVGLLYAVNTVAGIVGSLVAGFVLIPLIGPQYGVFVTALALALLGAYLLIRMEPNRVKNAVPMAICIVIALIALVVPGQNLALDLMSLRRPPGRLLFAEQDVNATVMVYESRMGREIDINGVQTAGTDEAMRTTQILQGHIPMMMHPNPEKVLMVGFGSGETANILTMYSIKTLHVAELLQGVLDAAPRFQEINKGIYQKPLFTAFVMDGKNYMKMTDQSYDVIMNDSIHPSYFGNAGLYSRDYFESAKKRLNPGGIMTSWIPLFDLNPTAFKMMVNSFVSVFPNSAMIYGHTTLNRHALLVARNDDGPILSAQRIKEMMSKPEIAENLKVIDIDDPLDIVNFIVLGQKGLSKLLADAELHTDAHPRLDYEAPRTVPGPGEWRANLASMLALRENPAPYVDMDSVTDATAERDRFTAAGLVMSSIASGDLSPVGLKENLEKAKEISEGVAGADRLLELITGYANSVSAVQHVSDANRMQLALAKIQAGDLAKAMELLEEELAANPQSVPALGNLGLVYLKQKKPEQAVEYFEQVLKIDPKDKLAMQKLGVAYFESGKYAEAANWFSKAENTEGVDAELFVQMGLAFQKAREYERAEEAFQKAIQKDPHNGRAYAAYGIMLHGMHRLPEAQQNLEKAIENAPNQKQAYGYLGLIYREQGNYPKAKAMFEKILMIDPTDAQAKQLLQEVEARGL